MWQDEAEAIKASSGSTPDGSEKGSGTTCGEAEAAGVRTGMNYYPPCPQPDLVMGIDSQADGSVLTLVQQGGVFVNDEKMTDATFAVTEDMLKAGLKIRKGKKVFHKAVLA